MSKADEKGTAEETTSLTVESEVSKPSAPPQGPPSYEDATESIPLKRIQPYSTETPAPVAPIQPVEPIAVATAKEANLEAGQQSAEEDAENNGEGEEGDDGPLHPDIAEQFSDIAVRKGFIRKTYGLLVMQLLITAGMVTVFLTVEPITRFISGETGKYMAIGSSCATLGNPPTPIALAMSCCVKVRRTFPLNLICLLIFTVATGFTLGCVTSLYETQSVILALGITVVVTVLLTIYAMCTKRDFTTCGGLLVVVTVIFLLGGILFLIFPVSEYAHIGYAIGGACLYSFYLIFHTQLLLGGNHKHAISPEESIFAALTIYLDIVNLFLSILRATGKKK